MFDAHVHLDFMANGEQVAEDAKRAGCRLLAVSVTPQGFRAARGRFERFDNVDVALGLHPWWVNDRSDAEELVELLSQVRFVGEVGLDFGKRHESTREEQLAAFATVARACALEGGKILSVHSVHAAEEALDILENEGTMEACTVIFHWYSGPSDQLKRAINAGCLFSMGERMLMTKKGRAYAKAIPANRRLLETDAPPERGQPYSFDELRAQLSRTEKLLAEITGAPTSTQNYLDTPLSQAGDAQPCPFCHP